MGARVPIFGGWAMLRFDPTEVNGVVYLVPAGTDAAPRPGVTWRLDEMTEVWCERQCVWKQE
jgi:hypothetical protein